MELDKDELKATNKNTFEHKYNEMYQEMKKYMNLYNAVKEENETLKESDKGLVTAIEEWINGERINDIKHISKDKIKAKIKEYETKATSIEDINVVRYTTKEEKSKIRLYRNVIKILKELLEE